MQAGPWSPTGSFVREPATWNTSGPGAPDVVASARVATLEPADGASVTAPTLRWTRDIIGTSAFRVTVVDLAGATVVNVITKASHFTPPTPLDPASGPFRWYVRPVFDDGQVG